MTRLILASLLILQTPGSQPQPFISTQTFATTQTFANVSIASTSSLRINIGSDDGQPDWMPLLMTFIQLYNLHDPTVDQIFRDRRISIFDSSGKQLFPPPTTAIITPKSSFDVCAPAQKDNESK